jgi:DNA-binding transcriptional regulator YiaG
MHREIAAIQGGKTAPARVWELKPDGKGGFTRRAIDPKAFQRDQKAAWDKSIAAIRQKLGLSQIEFAHLLGISVRTLRHWEQGTRTPSGATRVLLRVAALNPQLVLKAAA